MADRDAILFLTPHFTENVWGGTRLHDVFGYDVTGSHIGECWGISAHGHGSSLIRNGRFAGCTLREAVAEDPRLFGLTTPEFPLLVKLIDAADDLSIQVHPDDEYARIHENGSPGKSECWYILDALPGAELVLGHRAKTREELKEKIERGEMAALFRTVPVFPGDLIRIPPGTVHAIKGGILLLEIQQNSDITYRVYDYDRLWQGKKRELHVEKSLDVIRVPAEDPGKLITRKEEIERQETENRLQVLMEDPHFTLFRLRLKGRAELARDGGFTAATVIRGAGSVNGLSIRKGDHFILTDACREVMFAGDAELILSEAVLAQVY
ncbi:MAG: class I mannose-6-phosphate isomerase [Lachnospiraceae bacterium]|nr:class I mannose-6-phosphate isomerase [Lachnospiraceae bacterium]